MNSAELMVREIAARAESRTALWIEFIRKMNSVYMAEIGVYRGEFAKEVLKECDSIKRYHMIDPWRHLGDWNKPANIDDKRFEQFLSETKSNTEFAAEKRTILRGKTAEVVDKIPDASLDFAYIDGDHTLRGITIDLFRIYPKVKIGGWIGGDDFSRTIWQHRTTFEPTLVFPFAVFFAEAVGATIFALPFSQFLISKSDSQAFEFIDITGRYPNTSLVDQCTVGKILNLKIKEAFAGVKRVSRALKKRVFQ